MDDGTAKTETKPIAALAYLGFFVTGILFLYVEPFNQDDFIRFHARQSIGFSVAWFGVYIVLTVFKAVMPGPMKGLVGVLETMIDLGIAVFWVILMHKAYNGERYRIPELADIVDNIANTSAR
ncbi:MAG TPA: DUF4870 domain-containing protein [Candidatus Acidoferrales bacterium]|nr:DUF4870 domain-containing protein [Candidatus Acidoferrales bacterium]